MRDRSLMEMNKEHGVDDAKGGAEADAAGRVRFLGVAGIVAERDLLPLDVRAA